MTALPHPSQEPVDNPPSEGRQDFSGFLPEPERSDDRHRRVAAAWFVPLWHTDAGEAQVHGWRFCCPFCGTEREHDDYRETYGAAYRHLAICEWSDRHGLGTGTF